MFSEWLNNLRLRLRAVFRREQLARDLQDEVIFHLAMRAASRRADGSTEDEARYAAQRKLGDTTSLKEVCRDMWTFASFEGVLQDLRFGVRKLRKSPGFAIMLFGLKATNAVVLGATTALLLLVATLAAYIPAHRASTVDPIVALRYE